LASCDSGKDAADFAGDLSGCFGVGNLGTIVLLWMFEVGQLAVREATSTFRAQLATTVANWEATETNGGSEPEAVALISRQSGVRLLRQVATQRGIRNAGQMRKPELLAVLELG
jgi:hypothetical protein